MNTKENAQQNLIKTWKSEDLQYRYDEFYFLTDPDEVINMHRADDEDKQLLKKPVTLEQFVDMPFVSSIFFKNGLQFDPPVKAVLYTDNKGSIEVKVRLSSAKDIQFVHHLLYTDCRRRSDTEFRGAELQRFVFHSIVDGLALFSVQVPEPGTYSLEVFVSTLSEKTANHACEFKIVCEKSTSEACPLPKCPDTEWGPRRGEHLFGFKAVTHLDGVVSVDNDLDMKFKLPTKLRFVCKLHKDGVEDSTLEKFVNFTVSDDVLIVKVNPPQAGQYGLEIYAQKEDEAENNSYAYACKYLLNVARQNETTTFVGPWRR